MFPREQQKAGRAICQTPCLEPGSLRVARDWQTARLEGPAGTLPCEVLRAAATTRSCPRSLARDSCESNMKPDLGGVPEDRFPPQRALWRVAC